MTTVLALLLHLALGWGWTLGAGMVGGFWAVRRGWLVGGLGVGLGWLMLVGYNYGVAPQAVDTMTRTLGGILGNLPGALVVGVTLLFGVVLGLLGGLIGTRLALLSGRIPTAHPAPVSR